MLNAWYAHVVMLLAGSLSMLPFLKERKTLAVAARMGIATNNKMMRAFHFLFKDMLEQLSSEAGAYAYFTRVGDFGWVHKGNLY